MDTKKAARKHQLPKETEGLNQLELAQYIINTKHEGFIVLGVCEVNATTVLLALNHEKSLHVHGSLASEIIKRSEQ